jgi:hypothetical protein
MKRSVPKDTPETPAPTSVTNQGELTEFAKENAKLYFAPANSADFADAMLVKKYLNVLGEDPDSKLRPIFRKMWEKYVTLMKVRVEAAHEQRSRAQLDELLELAQYVENPEILRQPWAKVDEDAVGPIAFAHSKNYENFNVNMTRFRKSLGEFRKGRRTNAPLAIKALEIKEFLNPSLRWEDIT